MSYVEKNLNQKLLLIGVVIVVGIVCLYPPSKKLRGGLDIAGGISLIFEIDDRGRRQAAEHRRRDEAALAEARRPQRRV